MNEQTIAVDVLVVMVEKKISPHEKLIPSLSVYLAGTSKAGARKTKKKKQKYITQQNYPLFLNFDTILIVLR